MQQQARGAAPLGPEDQPLAKRQHVGRHLWRQLDKHAGKPPYLQTYLSCSEGLERPLGQNDHKLARIETKSTEARAIGVTRF